MERDVVLKLDFDNLTFEQVEDIIMNRIFVFYQFEIRPQKAIVMKTPHGYHIYIKAKTNRRLEDEDIVFIQLALGDDFKRACFNWERVRSNNGHKYGWNVLFTEHETYRAELTHRLTNKLRAMGVQK